MKVSPRSVEFARNVVRLGSDELIQAVDGGKVAVSRAAAAAKSETKERQLAAATAKAPAPTALRRAIARLLVDGQPRTVAAIHEDLHRTRPGLSVRAVEDAIGQLAQHPPDGTRLIHDEGRVQLDATKPNAQAVYRSLESQLRELQRIATGPIASQHLPRLANVYQELDDVIRQCLLATAQDSIVAHKIPEWLQPCSTRKLLLKDNLRRSRHSSEADK